ncbi:MAG: fasciclin domain-containing protein [Prevotella sp.]|nr:fasciclin domain-containing protein [Prevotella sp.]
MKSIIPKTRDCVVALGASLLLSGAGMLQSCQTDELTGQPDWLGNSIYERLQDDGNYTYTLRLIDDLNQTSVLSQTGSKTLFVADDNAYNEFFKSNSWGVRRYEDLSAAQKKLLLNAAMVNNAYLVELLSNVSGNPPSEGECMRRETAVSIYDSVARIYPAEMPNTQYWAKYKDHKDGIVLLRDNTSKPMIHFLPAYMKLNKITGEDLSILTNGASNSVADAWVNGKKIIERDIACKNGYIHKVDGVMTSSDNMAGIVHSHANMSLFGSLLDRYSAPYYNEAATKEYNRLYDNTDSVFVLRYFSTTSALDDLNVGPDGDRVDAQLSFDPGWNQYMYSNTAGRDLHYDAGAMLVPTNEALEYWWNHDGRPLQDMYGTWENVPLKVLVQMMNINMINTFSETVPSKFDYIVDNTTKVSLGITTDDVDSCFMGCNGVVYLINKVFSPAAYSSVSFPALVNENIMNVIYWGIENLNFEPYLNSMDSYYSFFIPTNTAMLRYVDPCSYGSSVSTLFEFYYDYDAKTVKAHRYRYDIDTQEIVPGTDLSDATSEQVSNRLTDLLNSLIIVGNVEDGHTYYKSKGGSAIKVTNAGQEGVMTVSGGLQIETGTPITVTTIYDQSETGNGKSYVVNDQMPLTSSRSTYSILNNNPEYSKFFELLFGSKLLSTRLSSRYTCADYNVNLFDAYNYTVYVPTNDAIEKLQADGILPDWGDYDDLTAEQFDGDAALLKMAQTIVSDRISNFLRYHIQDNSVFIGGEPLSKVKFETSKLNPLNSRFFSLTVSADDDKMTISDQLGNVRNVVKANGLYNQIGREYWRQASGQNDLIYNASDVVVHQIDGVLLYDKEQLTSWRDEVNALKTTNEAKGRR